MSGTQSVATRLLLGLRAGNIFSQTHFIPLNPSGYFIYDWVLHS